MVSAGLRVILTHFNPHYGPTPYLVYTGTIESQEMEMREETLETIAKFLDFQERERFFIHIFDEFGTANYYFEIYSEFSRGNIESLLISFVFEKNLRNPERLRGLLEKFALGLKKRKTTFYAFHPKKNQGRNKEERARLEKKVRILQSRAEEIVSNAHNGQILILGLDGVGKTSLLKKAKEPPPRFSMTETPTLGVSLVRLVIDEMKLLIYDIGGQKSFRGQWLSTLKIPNALIFVVDLTETKKPRLEETREEFHRVCHYLEEHSLDIPVLIVGNKLDLVQKVSSKDVTRILDTESLKKGIWAVYLTSAKTGEGVLDAFRWLIQALLRS